MSTWITIKDKEDIDYDPKDNTIDVLYSDDKFGNNYISIPVEFIKEILNKKTDEQI
jgi:hypothetical protein